jgi:AraC-like DNA-binding protein
VEQHFTHQRGIEFYADQLCLSPKYLSQVIFRESGNYAGEHIKRYVITEAKVMLKSKKYTVLQICDALGFESQSFFTKYFKNATGMTPTQYQHL